jgi:hypothetical protein
VSGGELYRLNDPKLSIERAAGAQPRDLTLIATDGRPSHLQAVAVTDVFFELFGLPMTLGGFTHDDFRPLSTPTPNTQAQLGPPPRIVISHRMWTQVYNRDPTILLVASGFEPPTGRGLSCSSVQSGAFESRRGTPASMFC